METPRFPAVAQRRGAPSSKSTSTRILDRTANPSTCPGANLAPMKAERAAASIAGGNCPSTRTRTTLPVSSMNNVNSLAWVPAFSSAAGYSISTGATGTGGTSRDCRPKKSSSPKTPGSRRAKPPGSGVINAEPGRLTRTPRADSSCSRPDAKPKLGVGPTATTCPFDVPMPGSTGRARIRTDIASDRPDPPVCTGARASRTGTDSSAACRLIASSPLISMGSSGCRCSFPAGTTKHAPVIRHSSVSSRSRAMKSAWSRRHCSLGQAPCSSPCCLHCRP